MATFYNPKTRKEHDIMFDRAGWGNYPRFTCLDCDGTILKKPYESQKDFVIRVKKWLKNHPNTRLEQELKNDN